MLDKLKRYEELAIMLPSLEKEKKELGVEIRDYMVLNNASETPKLNHGKIIMQKKIGYDYTHYIVMQEDQIKDMKKREELNGEAKSKILQYIKYSKSKK